MSMPGQHGLHVIHVPEGAGEALWVYGDTDNIKVASEDTGGAIAVMVTEMGPGDGPPPHVHHRENEAFYVLDGEMAALDGDRRIDGIGPGSFVFFPQESHHAFRNVGSGTARILLMFFPAGFEGYLRDVGVPVVEGQQPPETDLDDAAPIAARYGMEFVDVPPGVWD